MESDETRNPQLGRSDRRVQIQRSAGFHGCRTIRKRLTIYSRYLTPWLTIFGKTSHFRKKIQRPKTSLYSQQERERRRIKKACYEEKTTRTQFVKPYKNSSMPPSANGSVLKAVTGDIPVNCDGFGQTSVPDFFPETGCDDGVPSSRSVFPLHHHFLHFPLQAVDSHPLQGLELRTKHLVGDRGAQTTVLHLETGDSSALRSKVLAGFYVQTKAV